MILTVREKQLFLISLKFYFLDQIVFINNRFIAYRNAEKQPFFLSLFTGVDSDGGLGLTQIFQQNDFDFNHIQVTDFK